MPDPTPHANKDLIGVTIGNSEDNQSTIIGSAADDLDISWAAFVIGWDLEEGPAEYSGSGMHESDIDYAKNTKGLGTLVTLSLPLSEYNENTEEWEQNVKPTQSQWEDFVEDWADGVGDDVDYFLIGCEPNTVEFWAGTYTEYKNYCNWAIAKINACCDAKVLVGNLAGYDAASNPTADASIGHYNAHTWAEDLSDDCPNADGLAVHYYSSTISPLTTFMSVFMGKLNAGHECWLTETNLLLWYGGGNWMASGNPAPDYDATDAEILSYFEDVIDAADGWDGTLFFDYHGHRWYSPPGVLTYPRKNTCQYHTTGSHQQECFAIRGHSTLEDGIYAYLNGME